MIDRPHAAFQRLRINHLLPIVGIDVEHVAQITLDLLALRLGRLWVIVDPVLGPKRLQYLLDGISTILERDTGKYGVGAFVVRCGAVDAGERRGGRCPVQERRHVVAPPSLAARDVRGIVQSGVDLFAVASRSQPGVDIDPSQQRALGYVLMQHASQDLVAPGGLAPAVEQAIGILILAPAHGCLVGLAAMLRDPGVQPGLAVARRRPGRRQEHRMNLGVSAVDRQRRAEVDEVAIQVGVVLVDTSQVRKTIGVQRMQHEHRDARALDFGDERLVVQKRDLAPRSAKALYAVSPRNHKQESGGISAAEQRKVHRQLFARGASRGGMHVMHELRFAQPRRGQEFVARLGIALRKMRDRIHREIGIAASASAAR
jgi:hypothetical protein